MVYATDVLTAAKAEALFSSHLQTGSCPAPTEVVAAIARAVEAHGGWTGCTAVVAGEYREHPDVAVPRMRWALNLTIRTARPDVAI